MKCIKAVLIFIFLGLFISAFADSDYQQALPGAASGAASGVTASPGVVSKPANLMPYAGHQSSSQSGPSPASVSTPQNTNASIAVIMAKLMQLNQQLMQYQEGMNQQVQSLSQSNSQLASRLNQLSTTIQVVNQQASVIAALQQAVTKLKSEVSLEQNAGLIAHLKHNMGSFLFYMLMLGLLFVLLLLARIAWPYKKTQQQIPAKDAASKQSDYDYMATPDAMPVKLDLARAYIAMGDIDQAKQVLDEVLIQGNKEQQSQAQALLDEIGDQVNV